MISSPDQAIRTQHGEGAPYKEGVPRARHVVVCLALLLCGSAAVTAAETIYSNSDQFRIPFQFDAQELRRLQATEIQLFVSRDLGAHWDKVDSVLPSQGKFRFQAPADGTYWFSVKAAAGTRIYPSGPQVPALEVVVDRESPRIELTVEQTEPGRILLGWNAEDAHLDPQSLKLEFRPPEAALWQPIQTHAAGTGQLIWRVEGQGRFEIRGSIADAAGNVGRAEAFVTVDGERIKPERPDFRRPVATEPRGRPEVVANAPLSAETTGEERTLEERTSPSAQQDLEAAPLLSPLFDEAPLSGTHLSAEQMPRIKNAAMTPNHVPPIPVHVVNSTSFRIGYEFENVGPSGVGEVQLYITENGGEEWFHYGADPDRKSPFVVNVPGEKTYGFSFRISNGVGFVADPPQPGEPPEVSIVVDLTPPSAEIRPLQQGAGAGRNQVLLAWTAQDRELARQPVSIEYATAKNGPWQLIADKQPANGRYLWTIPRNADRQVYLRIIAADAAGNVNRVEAAGPLALDRSQVRARVTEIESVLLETPPKY